MLILIGLSFLFQHGSGYTHTFYYYFMDGFLELYPPLGIAFLVLGGASTYAVLSTTIRKSRERPIRFNRQRREVCYFPDRGDKPAIAPWEEVIAWVALSTGSNGANLMKTVTFGMALPASDGEKYWFLHREVPMVMQAQQAWETIRHYMDEPETCWPRPEPTESRATFDQLRQQLHEDFKLGPKNLFRIELLEWSSSYFGVFMFYVWNLLCGWKFPYWVAEWDQRYIMKPMPKSLDEWSSPLPEEQWAKPSPELLKTNAELKQFYQEDRGNLSDFFDMKAVGESGG